MGIRSCSQETTRMARIGHGIPVWSAIPRCAVESTRNRQYLFYASPYVQSITGNHAVMTLEGRHLSR